MTVSASWIGSIGCGTAASARDQVASQASCGRPVSTSDRRALVDLVLELLGDAHAAGGDGLAVEDRQVDAAGVHVLDDDRLGGHLDVLELGQVGVRTAAEREDHLLAGVRRRRCRRAPSGRGRGGVESRARPRCVTRSPSAAGCVEPRVARLEQVEPPVLARRLLHRRAHPLGEQHPEEHQRRSGRRSPTGSRRPGAGRRASAAARRPSARRAARGSARRRCSVVWPMIVTPRNAWNGSVMQHAAAPGTGSSPGPAPGRCPSSGQKNSEPTSTRWTCIISWTNGELQASRRTSRRSRAPTARAT